MPRKRLLPRTYRQRSPSRGHRHHPLTADHSFLAHFRYFALTESYTLATLDALHAHILTHDFVSALHLLALVLRARNPPPFLTVWQAGVAILRGLLASPTSSPSSAVTPMSIVRLLMSMLALDDAATALYRPQLAVEIALVLVCAGDVAQAYTHLDPLADHYPYSEDLHVVGVLGMICVALIEKHMPSNDHDKDSSSDHDDSDGEELPRASQPHAAAAPYLASARAAFDRLLTTHAATPTYLEYHLRYLTLAGKADQIPTVLERVLDALASVTVTDPRSLDAAELVRRREHVWTLAKAYGIHPPPAMPKSRAASKLAATDPSRDGAFLADPTLTAPWCPPPCGRGGKSVSLVKTLLEAFDYPVHCGDQWRDLALALYRLRSTTLAAELFGPTRPAWWFALHMTHQATDPVPLLVYKLAVMRLVVPDVVAATKDVVWRARQVQRPQDTEQSVRPIVEEVVGAMVHAGCRISVEQVYLPQAVTEEDEEEEEEEEDEDEEDDQDDDDPMDQD